MSRLFYSRHRFPPAIIQHAVCLYFRLIYRDVENLLAERGIDASYETVRRWALKFGRAYAARIRQRRPRPSGRWHLDEVFVQIGHQNGGLLLRDGQTIRPIPWSSLSPGFTPALHLQFALHVKPVSLERDRNGVNCQSK